MKILMNNETLFKDLEVFDSSFVPEEFLYRDSQMKALWTCIKPAIKGAKPLNALVAGKTATGKTTSVKMLFNEIKEQTERIIPVHINCQIYSTQYKIFSEIYRIVIGISPPTSGLPLSELFDKIFSSLSKKKKTLIVALDDSEIVFDKSNSTMYDILRGYEVYNNVKSAVWCITHKNLMHLLDDKTRSIYNPDIVQYPPYKQQEISQILRDRSEAGLYKGVISNELINLIAENSMDLRQAIESMKKSVLLAESESQKHISKRHVMKVLNIQEHQPEPRDQLENEIINHLKQENLESGELYEKVKRIANNYTKFYRAVTKLEKEDKISIKHIAKENGKTRLISLTK